MATCIILERPRMSRQAQDKISELPPFGQWLRSERLARGLNMTDMALLIDSDSPVISNLERGVRRPSRNMAERIARALVNSDDPELISKSVARGLRAAGFIPTDDEQSEDHQRYYANYSKLAPERQKIINELIEQLASDE